MGSLAMKYLMLDFIGIFESDDDEEDEPVKLEDMTPEQMAEYYHKLGQKKMEEMTAGEKYLAEKRLKVS